jgi:hypothetical protein
MKYKLLVNLLYLWLHTENQIEKSDDFFFSFALTSGYWKPVFYFWHVLSFFSTKKLGVFKKKLEWIWLLLLIFGTTLQENLCQKSEKTSNWNPPKSFCFQKMIFKFSLWQNLAYSKRLMRLKMLTFHQQQEWLRHFCPGSEHLPNH